MKNREKYAEDIKNYKGENFCEDFIKPVVLKTRGNKCECASCEHCRLIRALWLDEEYVEPVQEIDWSKVPVDTPILVRDFNEQVWVKRYFAKFKDGCVYSWYGGATSWSNDVYQQLTKWKYAKLAEVE